eukprot:4674920-Pyramimonas_sp.AAC.1
MQPPSFPPIQHERQTRIRPSATPPVISDGDFNKCALCLDHFTHHDTVWRLQCSHLFHTQCWDRVAHAHLGRQVAGTMEGAEIEAPCAICRGDAARRHGEIIRGANELRDLREELNCIAPMMMNNAAVATTTPAGQPAPSANV